MKYSDIVAPPPVLGVNRKRAAELVGGETMLELLISDYGLRPRHKQHKLTVFDVREIKEAWDRIEPPND